MIVYEIVDRVVWYDYDILVGSNAWRSAGVTGIRWIAIATHHSGDESFTPEACFPRKHHLFMGSCDSGWSSWMRGSRSPGSATSASSSEIVPHLHTRLVQVWPGREVWMKWCQRCPHADPRPMAVVIEVLTSRPEVQTNARARITYAHR